MTEEFKVPTIDGPTQIRLAELALAQKEAEWKVEQEKTKQEQERTKQLQLQKRKDSDDSETPKRRKTHDEQHPSATTRNPTSDLTHLAYYMNVVQEHLHSFNIERLLHDYDNIEDDMVKIFEDKFDPFMSVETVSEWHVHDALSKSINTLFDRFKHLTSLKYFNTSHHYYLPGKKCPDCTFIYKNVNIKNNNVDEEKSLIDFVIFLGEVKSSTKHIDDKSAIGQLCKYMVDILNEQKREKVYGFMTNLQSITFYYAIKEKKKSFYEFYQSQELDMFYMPPKSAASASSSSNIDQQTSNEQTRKRDLDKDTIKTFIKFLTMDPFFYEYTMLHIDPRDNLFGDQYYIQLRIGEGLTSMVYVLMDNNFNKSVDDRRSRVLKISRSEDYCDMFMNEINVLQQLKKLKDPNNLNLFFLNIEQSSPEGKFILFDNLLRCLNSITLPEAKQLISIIEYLYKCRIIHRDIRQENLMFDDKYRHLKLIDFGFAAVFEDDENTVELEIAGAVSYGGVNFLRSYLQELCTTTYGITYKYERNFDLQCALNVIMCMTDYKIARKLGKLKDLSLSEKISELCKLWHNLKETNENYNDLLNLIENVTNLSDFEPIKDRITVLFKCT